MEGNFISRQPPPDKSCHCFFTLIVGRTGLLPPSLRPSFLMQCGKVHQGQIVETDWPSRSEWTVPSSHQHWCDISWTDIPPFPFSLITPSPFGVDIPAISQQAWVIAACSCEVSSHRCSAPLFRLNITIPPFDFVSNNSLLDHLINS